MTKQSRPTYSQDDSFLISLAALEAFANEDDQLVAQIEKDAGNAEMKQAYMQTSLVFLSTLSDALGQNPTEVIREVREHYIRTSPTFNRNS